MTWDTLRIILFNADCLRQMLSPPVVAQPRRLPTCQTCRQEIPEHNGYGGKDEDTEFTACSLGICPTCHQRVPRPSELAYVRLALRVLRMRKAARAWYRRER